MNSQQKSHYVYYCNLLHDLLNKVQPCCFTVEDDGNGNAIVGCYATQIGASRGDVDEDLMQDLPLAKNFLCCAKWSKPDEPCRHWSPQGCQTLCLACRTWLCKPALHKLLNDYHTATDERKKNILELLAAIQEANGIIRNHDLVAKPHNSLEFCDAWKPGMPWED